MEKKQNSEGMKGSARRRSEGWRGKMEDKERRKVGEENEV